MGTICKRCIEKNPVLPEGLRDIHKDCISVEKALGSNNKSSPAFNHSD